MIHQQVSCYKWLERRGHRSKMNWEKMIKILENHPLPLPRIKVAV